MSKLYCWIVYIEIRKFLRTDEQIDERMKLQMNGRKDRRKYERTVERTNLLPEVDDNHLKMAS